MLCLMRWPGLKKVKDRKRTIVVVVVILLSIIFIIVINCSFVPSFIQVWLANTPSFLFQKTWSNGSWGYGWPWVYTSNCAENPISSTCSQLLWPAWVSLYPLFSFFGPKAFDFKLFDRNMILTSSNSQLFFLFMIRNKHLLLTPQELDELQELYGE